MPHASPGARGRFAAGIDKTQTKSVTLTNDGDAELVVSGLPTLSGDDSFTNPGTGNCGNAHLAPGGSCQTNISFTPTSNAIVVGAAHLHRRLQLEPRQPAEHRSDRHRAAARHQSTPVSAAVRRDWPSAGSATARWSRSPTPGGDDLRVTGCRHRRRQPGQLRARHQRLRVSGCAQRQLPVNVRFAPVKTGNRIANLIVHNNAGADLKVALTGHAVAPDDVTDTRAAAGCSDARFTWQNPDAAGFRVGAAGAKRAPVPAQPAGRRHRRAQPGRGARHRAQAVPHLLLHAVCDVPVVGRQPDGGRPRHRRPHPHRPHLPAARQLADRAT